jgi:hypothetical protein
MRAYHPETQARIFAGSFFGLSGSVAAGVSLFLPCEYGVRISGASVTIGVLGPGHWPLQKNLVGA